MNYHWFIGCLLGAVFCNTFTYTQDTSNTSECHISYRVPYTFTLEDMKNLLVPEVMETITEIGFTDEIREKCRESDDIFLGFATLVSAVMFPSNEPKPHPKDLAVTPLFWALNIDDCTFSAGKIDTPDVFVAFVCLVKHIPSDTSYLACRRGEITRVFSWCAMPYATSEKELVHHCVYRIDPEKDFQEQVREYLRMVDFGPNSWDRTRCTSLRVYCPKSDWGKFEFPYIGDEQRVANQFKYYGYKL